MTAILTFQRGSTYLLRNFKTNPAKKEYIFKIREENLNASMRVREDAARLMHLAPICYGADEGGLFV
jgi:hypothetical protein